jgi:hypothetical protein
MLRQRVVRTVSGGAGTPRRMNSAEYEQTCRDGVGDMPDALNRDAWIRQPILDCFSGF